MRATLHSGRANSKGQVYKAKHNDRQFDYESQSHIDNDKVFDDVFVDCLPVEMWQNMKLISDKELNELYQMDFTQSEKYFYKKVFGNWLKLQNEKHEKSRHVERIKTMDEIYNNKRFAPDETIFQYGNMEQSVPTKLLEECYDEYLKWHYGKFGEDIKILNYAIHNDEEVPHIHERKVFIYKDENDNYMPAQNKVLEKYYKLPEGTEKSRFNNLKQQYTAECRAKWEEIARSKGLEIAQDRLPKRKHQEKNEYILAQQEKKIAELQSKSAKIEMEISKKEEYLLEISHKIEKVEELDERLSEVEQQITCFESSLEAQIRILMDLVEKYVGETKETLKKAIENAREQFLGKPKELKDSVREKRSILDDLRTAKERVKGKDDTKSKAEKGKFMFKSKNMDVFYKDGKYYLFKNDTLKGKASTEKEIRHIATVIDKRETSY